MLHTETKIRMIPLSEKPEKEAVVFMIGMSIILSSASGKLKTPGN